jgi:predicted transcriptional regulator
MTNFKRYREFIGLKQNELAKLAGVSAVSIARLERVGCFDTRTASKYAKVLKCNPIFLLDGLNNG